MCLNVTELCSLSKSNLPAQNVIMFKELNIHYVIMMCMRPHASSHKCLLLKITVGQPQMFKMSREGTIHSSPFASKAKNGILEAVICPRAAIFSTVP